eukprot:m.22897 g.22897  ORF g.22897 m.22897 type:complete len:629 (+) comp8430_c0_seq3:84-1970(+)
MGLLSAGKPLEWPEVKKVAEHVRQHGIIQLINVFKRVKDRQHDVLLWGDEVECMAIKLDPESKHASLFLEGRSLLEQLEEVAKTWPRDEAGTVIWHPEYGRYMLETTPGAPYGGSVADFLKVEKNMALRRKQAESILSPDVRLLTLTVFPRLGCPNFTTPPYAPSPGGHVAKSLFFPDEAINEHPRFPTLTANIRRRRGEKVAMNVPIFVDEATPQPFVEEFPPLVEGDEEGARAALPDHIYMDAMGFGMGNSCLQITFQARSIDEARDLYDQLAVVCPIMLALSAASPIFRGFLADRDCRWSVIEGSVDCRTRQERGLEPLTTDKFVIQKSRYGTISSYLSQSPLNKREYEDVPLEMDDGIRQTLMEHGFDERLARHFAHLFIRDPVAVYQEKIDQDDEQETDHFENIQSTNWQTMRFKPPPLDSDIGWRVEFRPCEVQITDFENAAFTVFVVLLTRVILSFHLNLYMPLSQVDENMSRAQQRDAARATRFWFRKQLGDEMPVGSPFVDGEAEPDSSLFAEFTIDEIINGKPHEFTGLVPLIHLYLKSMHLELSTRCVINKYLSFISKKASGEVVTTATWMRDFVQAHPGYKHDSIVSDEVAYDLIQRIDEISQGAPDEALLGAFVR